MGAVCISGQHSSSTGLPLVPIPADLCLPYKPMLVWICILMVAMGWMLWDDGLQVLPPWYPHIRELDIHQRHQFVIPGVQVILLQPLQSPTAPVANSLPISIANRKSSASCDLVESMRHQGDRQRCEEVPNLKILSNQAPNHSRS